MKIRLKKIILMILLMSILLPSTLAFARAGGGGGGGGGGGRSSSSSHTSSGGSTRTSPIGFIVFVGFGILTVGGGAAGIKHTANVKQKKHQSKIAMKEFAKLDKAWDYDRIISNIDEAFYKIQYAWTERNQDLAKEYMSENLYRLHKSKTEWMKLKGEKNILREIELISINPISALNSDDDSKDVLWASIKACMIDYMLNENTNEIVSGDPRKRSSFEEFWRFIRNGDRWVLDEIRQVDEIEDIDSFSSGQIK